jgi:3-hydroxyacyl-[acyl-carrier-protein] dehydratase
LKKIKNEIEQLMSGLTMQEGIVTSCFVFPESFIGFQGHFPKHKILPGVCQIQCALSSLERAMRKAVELREVTLAKYFLPVLPDEEITCRCSDVTDAGEFTFKTVITKGSDRVAELKLRVAFPDGEKTP